MWLIIRSFWTFNILEGNKTPPCHILLPYPVCGPKRERHCCFKHQLNPTHLRNSARKIVETATKNGDSDVMTTDTNSEISQPNITFCSQCLSFRWAANLTFKWLSSSYNKISTLLIFKLVSRWSYGDVRWSTVDGNFYECLKRQWLNPKCF